jgi:hypothetical protein
MHRPGTDGGQSRVVALAGGTGLVGRAILEGLLADDSVMTVHALGRRAPGIIHPRLTPHVVDFAALPPGSRRSTRSTWRSAQPSKRLAAAQPSTPWTSTPI